MPEPLRELSLFSGAGGGLLATKHLLGWETLGYVEFDDYCQRVLRQRIRDGFLDDAPIFGDVRAFLGDGYARRYRGMVDVVSGGFPCQPFSVAGKRAGADDPRNMWPATLGVIRAVRPRFGFFENSPGLSKRGLWGILRDLYAEGYGGTCTIIGACSCGGDQIRLRLWICADRSRVGWYWRAVPLAPQQGLDLPRLGQTNLRQRAMHAGIGGIAYGVSNRMDRLRAIGNGQVPLVAARAWEILSNA